MAKVSHISMVILDMGLPLIRVIVVMDFNTSMVIVLRHNLLMVFGPSPDIQSMLTKASPVILVYPSLVMELHKHSPMLLMQGAEDNSITIRHPSYQALFSSNMDSSSAMSSQVWVASMIHRDTCNLPIGLINRETSRACLRFPNTSLNTSPYLISIQAIMGELQQHLMTNTYLSYRHHQLVHSFSPPHMNIMLI